MNISHNSKFISTLKCNEIVVLFILCYFSFLNKSFTQPAVHFNHVNYNADSLTYKQLSSDSLINALFHNEIRSTQSKNNFWSGMYFYTEENYFELFNAKTSNDDVGFSGIAFNVDQQGELEDLKKYMSNKYTSEIELIEKTEEGKNIPWFQCFGIEDSVFFESNTIYSWIMEYDKRYFDYYKKPYFGNQLTTKMYLEDKRKEVDKKHVQKITGLVFSLSENEEKFITAYFLSLGFIKKDATTLINQDGFHITISRRPPHLKQSLQSFTFDMKVDLGKVKRQLSDKVFIQINGRKAMLYFGE